MIEPYIEKIKVFFSDEERKMYAVGACTLVVVVLYLTFIVLPKTGEIARLSRAVSDQRDQINLVMSRVKKMEENKAKLESLRSEQRSYVKQLPPEKEVPGFLEGLSSIAQKAGVGIRSITPCAFFQQEEKGAQEVYYREIPFLITAKSGYHQLGAFISNLDETDRFVAIEYVKIQYDEKSPHAHNVRMMLKTYIAVDDTAKSRKAGQKDAARPEKTE